MCICFCAQWRIHMYFSGYTDTHFTDTFMSWSCKWWIVFCKEATLISRLTFELFWACLDKWRDLFGKLLCGASAERSKIKLTYDGIISWCEILWHLQFDITQQITICRKNIFYCCTECIADSYKQITNLKSCISSIKSHNCDSQSLIYDIIFWYYKILSHYVLNDITSVH